MATVTYKHANNETTVVEVEAGENVMSLAVNNMVEGIVGECGGAMACATCHCYVDESQMQNFGEVSDLEEAMLEMVPDRRANSRLSCQLELTDETPDITVDIPETQY